MTTISGATASLTGASGQSSQSQLDANYELFLSMLTTQIQNQDPLDPTDASQYTEQLVQYSSVEQQIRTNDQLSSLLQVIGANTASSYVSYLGTNVIAAGSSTRLSDGEASWTYNSPEGGRAKVEVRNELGAVIYSGEVELEQGENTYTWDGRTSAGSQAPDGIYSVSLARYDANDRPTIPVATEISGKVEGLEFTGAGAVLTVGGVRVPASAIISVSEG